MLVSRLFIVETPGTASADATLVHNGVSWFPEETGIQDLKEGSSRQYILASL